MWKYKQVDFFDFSVGKVYNWHGIVEIDQLVFGYDQMHLHINIVYRFKFVCRLCHT